MVHQPRPTVPKLPDPIRMWLIGGAAERNHQPPKGWRNRDPDGVGLGIVVALEKAGRDSPRWFRLTAPIAIRYPRASGPRVAAPGYSGELRRKRQPSCRLPPPAEEHFVVADFLTSCFLCRKNLHGKDIFMYREKAFCSMECRHRQITSDEYQEKRGAGAPKPSSEIATSPYSGENLFFTGIVVS
ncbi:hypothetical protein OPV22_020053 [Ensete ventricosum]|uniref:FLZ-type domain-containing protein n=1 Tax=Ensete ventricosum TaxID=4639 RepID=A0AAV8PBR5_ENSVE|nr:hypothetical protein OPV22_020053 [Ensete ventricosum]